MACLHCRMVRIHTLSRMYHVFARVVSRCLPCSFRLPECPPNCRGFPLTTLSLASSNAILEYMFGLGLKWLLLTSGQSNLTSGCIAAADGRFNRIFQVPAH